MRIFTLALFLLFTCQAFAQVDSTYIGFYNSKISVKSFVAKKFLFLAQENLDDNERMYMPNNPVEIGLGLSINNTVLSFGYGYGFSFLRDRKLGDTKSFDFQFHNYGRRHAFDIFFQKYKGFYREEKSDEKDQYILCPDLKIEKYGIYGEYVFNGKKFSYRAALDQSEKQLKSAGSFLLGGGVYYTNIQSDSSFVFNEKNSLKNFQFGVNAGYAQNWVLSRRYYIAGSVTAGINFGNESIDRIGKDKLEVYPSVIARISTGFNYTRWSIGFSYVQNVIFPSFADDVSIGLNTGHFQLTFSRRFDSAPLITNIVDKIPIISKL